MSGLPECDTENEDCPKCKGDGRTTFVFFKGQDGKGTDLNLSEEIPCRLCGGYGQRLVRRQKS